MKKSTLKKDSISAVIIVRNEESTIQTVVEESIQVLPRLTDKYEILVNDDASSDKTGNILDNLAKRYKFIKVFHQGAPLGISGGFEFLYKRAKNKLIFINSGDGQLTIKDLPVMLDKLNEGYDLVVGKRKTNKTYGFFRKIISWCYRTLPKLLFGYDLYEPGCNKVYKREVIKSTTPTSKSVFSEAERIIRAYEAGYKVGSVHINIFPRKKGSSSAAKPKIIFKSTLDMFRLFYILRLRGYIPLLVFILVLPIVIIINYFLLQPVLNNGVALDDWNNLSLFKQTGGFKEILTSIRSGELLKVLGNPYIGQIYYAGLLETIFQMDFEFYIKTNIWLKLMLTLTIYPTVLYVFKTKLLAFISTLLFAISYVSAGPLVYMVLGVEYISTTLVLIASAIYCKIYLKDSNRLLFIGACLFNLAYLFSSIRIFPIVMLLLVLEIILVFIRSNIEIKRTLLRVTGFVVVPLAISVMLTSGGGSPNSATLPINYLKNGNLFLTLYPLSALGSAILPLSTLWNIGAIRMESLSWYLSSLYSGPVLKYLLFVFLYSIAIKVNNRYIFNLRFFILSLLVYIAIYFIALTHQSLPKSLLVPHDPIAFGSSLSGAVFGGTIIAFVIALFHEWFFYQRNNFILLTAIGSIILSLGYNAITWFGLGVNFHYTGGVHRYFVIPSIFNSIFLGALLALLTKQRFKSVAEILKIITIVVIFVSLISVSEHEIAHHFNSIKNTGYNLSSQETMRKQTLNLLPNNEKDIYIYIEFYERNAEERYWDGAFDPYNFPNWYRIYRSYYMEDKSIEGCIATVYKKSDVYKNALIIENQEGFKNNLMCDHLFFPKSKFRALRLSPGLVSDITEQVLKEVHFKEVTNTRNP